VRAGKGKRGEQVRGADDSEDPIPRHGSALAVGGLAIDIPTLPFEYSRPNVLTIDSGHPVAGDCPAAQRNERPMARAFRKLRDTIVQTCRRTAQRNRYMRPLQNRAGSSLRHAHVIVAVALSFSLWRVDALSNSRSLGRTRRRRSRSLRVTPYVHVSWRIILPNGTRSTSVTYRRFRMQHWHR